MSPSEVTRLVGIRLARLRTDAGLSQTELAWALNVKQSTVAKWESGDREPTLAMLTRLARHFEVPVQVLLPWELGDLAWVEPLLAELSFEDRARLLAAFEQAGRRLGE